MNVMDETECVALRNQTEHSAAVTYAGDVLYLNFSYFREPTIFTTLDLTGILKTIAYAITIIGGLLGNISVILTVALNRSMRTTINYYVANLAVADAMICIFCMGPQLLLVLTHPLYPLGAFMCKFNNFMTREKLSLIPDTSPFKEIPPRTRWELVQSICRGFWKRWHLEYLHSLQLRSKWRVPEENLDVGDLVIVKESHLPPASWPLGRVIRVHPGEDERVRVVTIKTEKGLFKRNILKLIKLH